MNPNDFWTYVPCGDRAAKHRAVKLGLIRRGVAIAAPAADVTVWNASQLDVLAFTTHNRGAATMPHLIINTDDTRDTFDRIDQIADEATRPRFELPPEIHEVNAECEASIDDGRSFARILAGLKKL